MRRLAIAALVAAAAWSYGAPRAAAAEDTITVGIYAPSAPFDGPVQRLDYVSGLATHIAERVGAKRGVGRAYASATDFAAAVRRGDIQYAVIDAPYSAARGNPYKILATATRSGDAVTDWMLVTTGSAGSVRDLKGKVIALPKIGAKNTQFLTNVLLDGEIESGFFKDLVFAPDALSAVTSVKLGRADAAFVPAGVDLPSGVRRVFTVRGLPWPVLVALPGSDAGSHAAVASAAASYSGPVFSGFSAGEHGSKTLARRFSVQKKRGPMAVPTPRLNVTALFEARTFAIERPDVAELVDDPALHKAGGGKGRKKRGK